MLNDPVAADGSRRRSRAFLAATLALLALAGLLRFQSLDAGLPHWGSRPDELPVIHLTRLPAEGEFNLRWSMYPPAYVYTCWLWAETVLGAGRVLGIAPPEDYPTVLRERRATVFLVDRAFTALVGTLCVLLLVLLARRDLGEGAALCAGLLLATCFLHVRDSHAVKPDVLLSAWVVVTFLAAVPLAQRATLTRGCLAGAAVGAAMAAKYPGVVLALPVYLACVAGTSQRGLRRLLPMPAVGAGIATLVVFLGTSPHLVLDPGSARFLLRAVQVVFPQGALAAFLPDVETTQAVLEAEPPGLRSLAYHARVSLWHGFGPAAALLAPLAIGWGLWRRAPLPTLAAVFTLAWFAMVSLSPHFYARYLTPLAPILLLLEAAFLAAVAARLGPGRAAAALALASLCVAGPTLWSSVQFNRLAGRTDTRVLASEWMAEHLPRGSRVGVVGTVFWPWGAPEVPRGLEAVAIQSPDGRDPEPLVTAGVEYVVTHDHDQLHWSTVPASWLESARPGLRELAVFDPRRDGAGREPVFEGSDAYYIPIHGFDALVRPGPVIRIYANERGSQ